MLKNGIRHSNIELQCAHRRTNVVEEKGENNKSVTESFKLVVLRSYKNFQILTFFCLICLHTKRDTLTLKYNVLVEALMKYKGREKIIS